MLISLRLGSCKPLLVDAAEKIVEMASIFPVSCRHFTVLDNVIVPLLRYKSFHKMENTVRTFRCGLGETFHLAARVNGQGRSWVCAHILWVCMEIGGY